MDETQVATTFMIPLISALLLTMAVVYLFYGWRVYWLFVTMLTALAAAIVGWYFISPHVGENIRYLPPLLLGLAGGAIAIPLERVVAFATHGALGAFVAVAIAVGFCDVPLEMASPQIIAIAAAGFLAVGVPAAIFFKFFKVVCTAGYGAAFAILGTATVASVFFQQRPELSRGNAIVVLAIWFGLTTIGVIVQWKSLIVHKAQTASS